MYQDYSSNKSSFNDNNAAAMWSTGPVGHCKVGQQCRVVVCVRKMGQESRSAALVSRVSQYKGHSKVGQQRNAGQESGSAE